jgi:hypothetical protein
VGFTSAWRRVKHQKVIVHLLVNLHDACLVTTTVTVVWRTKNRDHLLVLGPIKALNQ